MTTRSMNQSSLPVWVAAMGLGVALPLLLLLVIVMWALVIVAGMALFVGIPIGVYMIGSRLLSIRTTAEPVALVRRKTTEIMIPAPVGAIAVIPDFEPLFETVSATVTRAHGTCPMGQTFKVGERYQFNNGHVEPGICPVAEKAIRPLVEQMRRGEYPAMILPQCVTKAHEVVFVLEGVPVEAGVLTPA